MKRSFNVGQPARDNLIEALAIIAEAVGSTMGPGGRPFGYDKLNSTMKLMATFSKDGLTVLKSLHFTDPSWGAVLQYCKQAAAHSVMASGDGTTSTIVLANAVAKAVANAKVKWPQAFARHIEAEAAMAIEAISKEAIMDESTVRQVALTSTNGDEELADIVLAAIKTSSAFGTILVDKNAASPVRYRITRQDGYSNVFGYNYNNTFAVSASPDASASKPIEWENPYVVTFNGDLYLDEQIDPILKAWNDAMKVSARNLLIVAYQVGDQVTNKLLVLNRKMAASNVAAFVVQTRLTAEINSGLQIMRDIAAFCGIEDKHMVDGGNYKNMTAAFLGTCGTTKVSPNGTAFLGRAHNHWVDKRILQNNSIVDEARSDLDREITAIRNAELSEGLVKVEVGGGMLPDLQERADRFDDASRAAQACMRRGALPGAGCSYIRAGLLAGVSKELEEAFRSIHNSVLINYGVVPNLDFVPPPGQTVSLTNLELGDAREIGVLDATETVCAVIKNGVNLGVKIATMGGYSYRDAEQASDYE